MPGGRGFDRDALLEARSRRRRPIQRGLFERRAERNADEAEALTAAATGRPHLPHDDPTRASLVATPPPEPVLLLFVTS
jgi:hypothetical protein